MAAVSEPLYCERVSSTCAHCGLAAPPHKNYCCFGCELAAQTTSSSEQSQSNLYSIFTFSLLLSMAVMMLSLFLFAEDVYDAGEEAGLVWMRTLYKFTAALLSTPVVIMLGFPLLKNAIQELKQNRLSMNLLIGIGAIAAYGLSIVNIARNHGGVFFDSATSALVLATLGRYLEASARSKASRVIAPSLRRATTAVMVQTDLNTWVKTEPNEIVPGMRICLDTDQVLPVDAVIAKAQESNSSVSAEFNLSLLSGRITPEIKHSGDEIPAGAIAVSSQVECIAIRRAEESTLEHLCQLASALNQKRTRLQRVADTFAAVLTPIVLLIAISTFAIHAYNGAYEQATLRFLAVVLAACPCTYGVTTPLVLWLALRKSLEQGVCIRSAATIEALSKVKTVAFDKTGTLSYSELRVLDVNLHEKHSTFENTAALILALEKDNKHPLAQALRQWANHHTCSEAALTHRTIVLGRGIEGLTVDGKTCRLGSPQWICDPSSKELPQSGIALAVNGNIVAHFTIGEYVRFSARKAIAALSNLSIMSVMTTGDSEQAAREIAGPLGIQAYANLLPQDKVATLQQLGPNVAMVGDGFNDVPALASIGTSFSMESGTNLAKGLAQVTLLRNDLTLIPWTISMARKTTRIGIQNLILSTAYNTIFLVLATTGHLKPVWAGVSMFTSSILTLLSSMRVSSLATNTTPDPINLPTTAEISP